MISRRSEETNQQTQKHDDKLALGTEKRKIHKLSNESHRLQTGGRRNMRYNHDNLMCSILRTLEFHKMDKNP